MGTHVFLRVKCTHTLRLRTAYGMIHSYYSTTILCTMSSANDLLRFFAHRCQYKLSRRRACCLRRGCSCRCLGSSYPWTFHTLVYCIRRTDACTSSPFVDPKTPMIKGERPQAATSMCVNVCIFFVISVLVTMYERRCYCGYSPNCHVRIESQATDLERRTQRCCSGWPEQD